MTATIARRYVCPLFRLAVLPLAVAGLCWQTAVQAGEEHHHAGGEVSAAGEVGQVDFQVDCDPGVQADFDRALALLHHMMYEQARHSFQDISRKAPDCAMAYWGYATTLFQPLWGTRPPQEDLDRGWEAVQQARQRVTSEREQRLLETTEAFFREPDSAAFRTRIQRWTETLEATYQAYPEDEDIAALYGLALLTRAQQADDRGALHDEAEAVLRDIYQRIPRHPGAIHYSIHATDVDGRAANALDMVEDYARIAPEVPHALHMPSHIYVRLGDWPAVIAWNRRSAEAARTHEVNGGVSHHYIHAMDYLVYAHLQRGEVEEAEAAFAETMAVENHQSSFVSAFHFAAMPARLAVEQRDWERAAALEPRDPDYLPWDASPWAEGLTWYARGLGAVHTGDLDAAAAAEEVMTRLQGQAEAEGDTAMATYIEVDRRILAGWLAHARGDSEEAESLMRSAAELEGTVEKHPVTPGALVPPYEALGDLLVELDRPGEALEAYQASDAIWPGRRNTRMGLEQAGG